MDNYTALLLLVVPGFISRKIYEKLSDQRPTKNSFEETIYSLIFSVFNLLTLYLLAVFIFWITGYLYLLSKESIVDSFNNSHLIALYVFLNLFSSFLTAGIWKLLQPHYVKLMSRLKNGENGNEIIPSNSVFHEVLSDGNAHLVEVYKEDKFIARGILSVMHHEEGEYYLEDAEEEFKILQDKNEDKNEKKGKLQYKGYCVNTKTGLIIKKININTNE